MPSINAMTSSTQKELIQKLFEPQFHQNSLRAVDHNGKEVNYYQLDREHNQSIIVLASPVRFKGDAADAPLTWDEAIGVLQENRLDLNGCHLIVPVVGMGATEKHIVTAYKAPGHVPTLFDSKTSNPERLLSVANEGLLSRFAAAVAGLFRSIVPRYRGQATLNEQVFDYQALNTQSYFDPLTCGHHTAVIMKSITDLLMSNRPVNRDAILSHIDALPDSPVTTALRHTDFEERSIWSDAWHETFVAPEVKRGRAASEYSFGHYFMGWPKDGLANRTVHSGSGQVIVRPIINLLKIPTQFLLLALANGMHRAKDKLLQWSPTSVPTQIVRSTVLLAANGVHYALEGLHLYARALMSPVTSYRKGRDKHWALGLLSAAVSLASYVVISGLTLGVFPAITAFMASFSSLSFVACGGFSLVLGGCAASAIDLDAEFFGDLNVSVSVSFDLVGDGPVIGGEYEVNPALRGLSREHERRSHHGQQYSDDEEQGLSDFHNFGGGLTMFQPNCSGTPGFTVLDDVEHDNRSVL